MAVRKMRDIRKGRRAWRWTRQGVLNLLLVCLMTGVVLGRQLLIQPRVLQQVGGTLQTLPSPPVQNLRLTDIYLPKTLRIEWDGAIDGAQAIKRASGGGTPVPLDSSGLSHDGNHWVYIDTFDFQYGTTYTYTVTQVLPPDAYTTYTESPAVAITVTPRQAAASDDQAVDARYDMRYSTWTFQDHHFGATSFRGGLFAGYQADDSKVGRSYVKFAFPTPDSGDYLWPAGSVNAWFTRLYSTGSVTVGCQTVSSTWDPTTLAWTNAPAFSPAAATTDQRFTVAWDSANPPAASWAHWGMRPDILTAAAAGNALAVGLGAVNEPSTATNPIGGSATGWAYFAKKEYKAGADAPCALYATGAQPAAVVLTLAPASVTAGGSATGAVFLNGPAPSGGTNVGLTSAVPSQVGVPASVTVPAAATSATFTVTTTGAANGAYTITADTGSGQGWDHTVAQLTVTP